MGNVYAERFPDNELAKRLPPQGFYTSYLSILFAPVSAGARETLQFLSALSYNGKPLWSPTRGNFERDFEEISGAKPKTQRDHFKELARAGFIQCYRASGWQFLVYVVGIVPLPEATEQLDLLDVGEPEIADTSKVRRKSAKKVGENPPKSKGQVGRSAILKPTYLPNPNTTVENLTVKVGENPPNYWRKSAKVADSAPQFGENPPKLKREKEPPPHIPQADTSQLSTEAIAIYERLAQAGFWGDPVVLVARDAVKHGHTADEIVAKAQTIIVECENDPDVRDPMNVAIHRLAKFVVLPKRAKKQKKTSPIKAEFFAALEEQDAEIQAKTQTTRPLDRAIDFILDTPLRDREWALTMLTPDERAAWDSLPAHKREALLAAPKRRTG